jgi:hypothetical protein
MIGDQRIRELDQREQPDFSEADAFGSQPRRYQLDQQVERQTGRKPGEHAYQHAPVQDGLFD